MAQCTPWRKYLKRLEQFAAAFGYKVEIAVPPPGVTDFEELDLEAKLIRINQKQQNELQVYIFLHELGHLLSVNEDAYVVDNFSRSSKTYKLARIKEELDAWDIGLKLAKMLKLKINRKRFESYKTRCLMTYINFYSLEKKEDI